MREFLKHEILEFHPDTLLRVRESCGLEGPGRMDEAVGMLRDWAARQEHFLKKDFPQRYLETTLNMSKGSVEKSKQRLDMICTMRTFQPQLFGKFDAKNDFKDLHDVGKGILLPRLTEDHCRVVVLKLSGKHYASFYQELFQYIVIVCEYLKLHDYCKGFILILDPTEINLMDFVTKINLIELRDITMLVTKAYGARIKSIHLATPSKAADIFISMAKQVLSAKIISRVSVQKTLEELHQFVPKRVLPEDLGGEERAIDTLYDEWLDVLSSEEHVKHMREMQEARTDESRRRVQLDDALFGLAGTFRALDLD